MSYTGNYNAQANGQPMPSHANMNYAPANGNYGGTHNPQLPNNSNIATSHDGGAGRDEGVESKIVIPPGAEVIIKYQPDIDSFYDIGDVANCVRQHDAMHAANGQDYVPYFITSPCYSDIKTKAPLTIQKSNGKAHFVQFGASKQTEKTEYYLRSGNWDQNGRRMIAQYGINGFREFVANGKVIPPVPGRHNVSMVFDQDSIFVYNRMLKDCIHQHMAQYPRCESIKDINTHVQRYVDKYMPKNLTPEQAEQEIAKEVKDEMNRMHQFFKYDRIAYTDPSNPTKTEWRDDVAKGLCVRNCTFKTNEHVILNQFKKNQSFIKYMPVVPYAVKDVKYDDQGYAINTPGCPLDGNHGITLQEFDQCSLECVPFITVKGYIITSEGIKLDFNLNHLEIRKARSGGNQVVPPANLPPARHPRREIAPYSFEEENPSAHPPADVPASAQTGTIWQPSHHIQQPIQQNHHQQSQPPQMQQQTQQQPPQMQQQTQTQPQPQLQQQQTQAQPQQTQPPQQPLTSYMQTHGTYEEDTSVNSPASNAAAAANHSSRDHYGTHHDTSMASHEPVSLYAERPPSNRPTAPTGPIRGNVEARNEHRTHPFTTPNHLLSVGESHGVALESRPVPPRAYNPPSNHTSPYHTNTVLDRSTYNPPVASHHAPQNQPPTQVASNYDYAEDEIDYGDFP